MNTILFPDDNQNNIEDIIEVETPEHSCGDPKGYFLVENAFSELVDEYQRNRARKNLGIADSGDIMLNAEWGHIVGNLEDQEDLMSAIKKYAFVDGAVSHFYVYPEFITSDTNDNTQIRISWGFKSGADISIIHITIFQNGEVKQSATLTGDSTSYSCTVGKGDVSIELTYKIDNVYHQYKATIEDKPVIRYTDAQGRYIETNETSFVMDTSNIFGHIVFNKDRNYQIAVDGLVGGFEKIGQTNTDVTYKAVNPGLGKLNITLI